MNNQYVIVSLGNLAKQDTNATEAEKEVLEFIGRTVNESAEGSVGMLDMTNKESTAAMGTALEAADDDTLQFAVVSLKVMSLSELKEQFAELLPQHEHNKSVN